MIKPRHLGKPLNYLYAALHHKFRRSRYNVEGNYPKTIYLELTSACNLKCPMCPHTFMERTTSSISEELVEKLADELGRHYPQLKLLSLHGFGEAVYHPKMGVLVGLLRSRLPLTNLSVSLNLAVARREHIDALFENGITEIGCWIDATNESTYLAQRQRGRFQRTLDNIDYVLELKRRGNSALPYFHIGMVLTRLNLPELPSFIEHWERKLEGIPGVSIRSTLGHTFNGKIDDSFLLRPKLEWFLHRPCSSPFQRALILSNGEICVCCFDAEGESSLGNLSDMSLREAWQSEKAQTLREQMYKANYDLEMCQGCDSIRYYPIDGRPPSGSEYLTYERSLELARDKKTSAEPTCIPDEVGTS